MPQFKVNVVPTITVRSKDTGKEVVINESDFNAEQHERLRARLDKTKQPESAPAVSAADSDELSKMSVAALRELPEWARVANKSALATKADMVQAILDVREDSDELNSLTVADLKSLPEWDRVENKGAATTKDEIIQAILDVREAE